MPKTWKVINDDKKNKVSVTLHNLRPCSDYSLQIYPTVATGELNAETTSFLTASLAPTTPGDLVVGLNILTNRVDLHWSSVQCATGYKIHKKPLDQSESDTEPDITEELVISLDSPAPCSTYR